MHPCARVVLWLPRVDLAQATPIFSCRSPDLLTHITLSFTTTTVESGAAPLRHPFAANTRNTRDHIQSAVAPTSMSDPSNLAVCNSLMRLYSHGSFGLCLRTQLNFMGKLALESMR